MLNFVFAQKHKKKKILENTNGIEIMKAHLKNQMLILFISH